MGEGRRKRTYKHASERTTEDEADVSGEVLVVLFASLSNERSESGDLLSRRESSDEVVHILCPSSSGSAIMAGKEIEKSGRTDENNVVVELILPLPSLTLTLTVHLRHLL